MMTNKSIRQAARHQLKQTPNKYKIFLTPILLILIYTGIERILLQNEENLTLPGFRFIPLFAILFTLSASLTMLDIWRKKQTSPTFTDSTRSFSLSYLGRYLLVSLLHYIYFMLFYLFSIVILGLIAFVLYFIISKIYPVEINDTVLDPIFVFVLLIVVIIGLMMYGFWYYTFSQVELILTDQLESNTYKNPHHVLMTSRRLMKGHRKQAFLLDLSFMPWLILSVVTANLLMIYILPYYTTAKVVFYDQVTKHHQS
ncbi:DUF975 family protein [Streptococcus sp. sy004]|uniref:DUF975 family protein n=1 Tax=Streptococcus sp. sy004 TaxID=2600149 RepID=UPI00164759A3|nr:DUF975 family protein [Streptococcus sp. sy004]